MNDFMYEQLVSRKAKASDFLIRGLIIVLIIALIAVGPAFLGFIAILLALALALAAAFLIFPRLKVEYEYILLNHEIQIDVIYNKSRRKTMLEFDIRKADLIAPASSDSIRTRQTEKTLDFSSGHASDQVYAVILPLEQNSTCILLEPDDTMKSYMNNWLAPHMQLK